MDRDRLREVHRTDTTESRVNEDFVDWLKNKGPTWLLVVLVAFTAFLVMVRWRESRNTQKIQAWQALADSETSGLPSSYETIAEQYPEVDGIAQIARLRAASRLLSAVQTDRPLGSGASMDPEAQPAKLSDLDREQYLSRADRQYQAVLDADDGSWGMTLHAVTAYNGRAAIAEANGDATTAREMYIAAADRAEGHFPELAVQARSRAETTEQYVSPVTLPADEQGDEDILSATGPIGTSGNTSGDTLRPARIEPPVADLLLPQQSGSINPGFSSSGPIFQGGMPQGLSPGSFPR